MHTRTGRTRAAFCVIHRRVRARKSLAVLLVLRRPPYRRLFSFVCVRAFRVTSSLPHLPRRVPSTTLPYARSARMVRMSVLADCLKSLHNAEKRGALAASAPVCAARRGGGARVPSPASLSGSPALPPLCAPAGKRQVMIRPSSRVIVKFLEVMQAHSAWRRWTGASRCAAVRGGGCAASCAAPRARAPSPRPRAHCRAPRTLAHPPFADYIGEFELVDDHRSGKIVVDVSAARGALRAPLRVCVRAHAAPCHHRLAPCAARPLATAHRPHQQVRRDQPAV